MQIIDKTISRFEYLEQQRNVTVVWERSALSAAIAYIDENLFGLAIEEALSNAIKYSYSDCDVHVSLKTKMKWAYYKIRINNYGVAIPNDELERIFQPGS